LTGIAGPSYAEKEQGDIALLRKIYADIKSFVGLTVEVAFTQFNRTAEND
jgi:hypothetical protein